jgi:hypothetical protein
MYVKSLGFIIALTISLIASSAYAQSRAPTGSVEDLQTSDHANGSIVIISEEKTGIPGYFRVQYAFVDQSCGPIFVDHYGPAINPNDKALKQAEQRACVDIAMNSHDGED